MRVKYVESATPPRFDVIDFLFKGGGRGRVRRRFAERNSSILSHSEKREGPHPTNMVPQCVCVCVTHSLSHLFNPNVRHTREREREKREEGERNQIEATATTLPSHHPLLFRRKEPGEEGKRIKQTNQCGTYKQDRGSR